MPADACPHVHAAFYLWYGTPAIDGKWLHWDHRTMPHWTAKMNEQYPPGVAHTPPDHPHSPYYPARGLYSSSDNATLLAQMRELAEAGVDSVMLSWWGQAALQIERDSQGVSTDPLVPRVLDAAAEAGIGVSWHLEPYGGRTAQTVLADLRYLHERYGSHAAIWREGPRRLPLVWLYDVSMEHVGEHMTEWRAMVAALRGSEADAVLLSLYLDARDADFVDQAGLDGAYTYFASDGFTEGSTSSKWLAARRALASKGKLFVTSVGPGYDDTRIRPWNGHNTRSRERGAYYERQWRAALEAAPHAVSITSYNEWGEGTQIEPARPHTSSTGRRCEDYAPDDGAIYMRLTREWAERARRRCQEPRQEPAEDAQGGGQQGGGQQGGERAARGADEL